MSHREGEKERDRGIERKKEREREIERERSEKFPIQFTCPDFMVSQTAKYPKSPKMFLHKTIKIVTLSLAASLNKLFEWFLSN